MSRVMLKNDWVLSVPCLIQKILLYAAIVVVHLLFVKVIAHSKLGQTLSGDR